MAGIKISNLPAVASALLTDFGPFVQAGVTSKVTLLQIGTLFGFSSGILALANGGTSAALTAANGAVPYSTATAFALLAPGSSGQLFQSGGAGAPAWTTATYPATTTINQLLYSSSANVIAGLSTTASATLITSAGGVPSMSQTLPSAVQTNITALGAQVQALNMNTHLINNVVDPVSAQDAATKNYVDQTALNGTSVYAASAASLGTVTQSGAGIGATLTNAGVQATFSLDGVSPPVGTNVLIKNTAVGMTAANEGIYTVTSVGSGATNWVLTRASSYDTATEVNNTGLILVQNGSTLIGTAWYNAATIVTVDTTNFNYTQFGNITFPISLANGGTNASLTASNGGIFYSTATAGAILAGTATAGQMLQSGASTTPAWSTATYPATAGSSGKILISDGTNIVSSTPTYPNAAGTSGNVMKSDGTNFVSSAVTFLDQVVVQTFTGSGTYTPTTGMKYCQIECLGGGGAGGSSAASTAGSNLSAGGGGAGSYSRIVSTAATIGASQTVTIGAGGTSAGANTNTAGGNGGDTSVGTICIGKGGTGGGGATGSTTGRGGAGGVAGTGAFTAVGNYGADGYLSGTATTWVLQAGGASSVFGGSAGSMQVNTGGASETGRSASVYGAGGNAGASTSAGAGTAGGAGGAGVVIITEYVSV